MTFQLMSYSSDDVTHMTSNHTGFTGWKNVHWTDKIFIGQKNAHWVENLYSGSHLGSGRLEQRSNLLVSDLLQVMIWLVDHRN
jgi:hypothetical protein